MAEYKHMETCFLCQRQFQYGPHVYNGTWLRSWQIIACRGCLSGNHDGIVPTTFPHLLDHLKAKGVKLTYNDQGWICLPSN